MQTVEEEYNSMFVCEDFDMQHLRAWPHSSTETPEMEHVVSSWDNSHDRTSVQGITAQGHHCRLLTNKRQNPHHNALKIHVLQGNLSTNHTTVKQPTEMRWVHQYLTEELPPFLPASGPQQQILWHGCEDLPAEMGTQSCWCDSHSHTHWACQSSCLLTSYLVGRKSFQTWYRNKVFITLMFLFDWLCFELHQCMRPLCLCKM
jgi:hypothetical protein